MGNNRIIGGMYGVLILLKEEYEAHSEIESFEEYSEKRVKELYSEAYKWLVEYEELNSKYEESTSEQVDRENCEAIS